MHCEMQKLVSTESGIIIPAHTNIMDAHHSSVQGFSNCPLGQFGGNGWADCVYDNHQVEIKGGIGIATRLLAW